MSDNQVAPWLLSPLAPIIESMMDGIPDLIEALPIDEARRYVEAVQKCCEYLIKVAEGDPDSWVKDLI